jgi:hypothetical protein
MKTYDTLLALSKDEREASFVTTSHRADRVKALQTACEKHIAKLLTAMIASKECEPGKLREKSMALTGKDIKSTLQSVYGLTNVFGEIVNNPDFGLTEEEFDTLDKSKVDQLSTFLGEKNRHLLDEAIELARNGTVKEMRDLKPKKDKAEKDEPAAKPAAQPIAFGFIATDIGPDAPLVTSVQAMNRLKADFERASLNPDMKAGDDALNEMLHVFSTMLVSVAAALETSAHDVIDEILAKRAAPAAGATVETPDLLAIPA